MIRININEPFCIEVLVTGSNGKGVSGLKVEFSVVKNKNEELIFSGLLTSVGKGCYKTDVIFSEPGQYRLLIEPPEYYTDLLETIIVDQKSSRRVPL